MIKIKNKIEDNITITVYNFMFNNAMHQKVLLKFVLKAQPTPESVVNAEMRHGAANPKIGAARERGCVAGAISVVWPLINLTLNTILFKKKY